MNTYTELGKLSLEEKVKYYLTKGWYGVTFGRQDKTYREEQINYFNILFVENMNDTKYFEIKNNTLYINKKYIYDTETLENNVNKNCITNYLDQIDKAFSKWLKARKTTNGLSFSYIDNIHNQLSEIEEIHKEIKSKKLGGKTFKNQKYLEKQIQKDFFYIDWNIKTVNSILKEIISINIYNNRNNNYVNDNYNITLSDGRQLLTLEINWDVWKDKVYYDEFKFKFIDKLKQIIKENNLINLT